MAEMYWAVLQQFYCPPRETIGHQYLACRLAVNLLSVNFATLVTTHPTHHHPLHPKLQDVQLQPAIHVKPCACAAYLSKHKQTGDPVDGRLQRAQTMLAKNFHGTGRTSFVYKKIRGLHLPRLSQQTLQCHVLLLFRQTSIICAQGSHGTH